ncbi:MAG: prepilin-type N-terminal cleavage/methylation domain-containing protein [Planctomycetaceae bacterium]|nr:prepilin-type N-terminal cleavage/methylation domain-containing protein [Planctomycetaceae bacterium]
MQRRPLRLRPHGSGNRGFTLLEIVLGMAIFFGSLAIFSQILWSGSQAAVQGQLRSQALVRCEAKLGEVVAGAMPFQTQQNQAFSSDAIDQDWSWSVDVEPTNHPNLNAVVVTVSHTGNSPLSNAEVQLRRWMRDPAQMALVAQEAAQQEQENKDKEEQAKLDDENEKAQSKKNTGNQGKNDSKDKNISRVEPSNEGNPPPGGTPPPGGNPPPRNNPPPGGNPPPGRNPPPGFNPPPGWEKNVPPEWKKFFPPGFFEGK